MSIVEADNKFSRNISVGQIVVERPDRKSVKNCQKLVLEDGKGEGLHLGGYFWTRCGRNIFCFLYCFLCGVCCLGNKLVIPETAIHSQCAPRLIYTIGHHHASCFAPFGFEDMGKPFNNTQGALFGIDVTDPLLEKPQNIDEYRFCAKTLKSKMESGKEGAV